MGPLPIPRVLGDRRRLMALGALLSIAVGLLVSRGVSLGPVGAPDREVLWIASARVLIDTADSQLVNAAPLASETLPMRATIVADLLASGPVKAMVARRAQVPADQLDVLGPSSRAAPPVRTPLVQDAIGVASVPRAPYVLSAYADGVSPMISIEANAPDAGRAVTLAEAATGGLRSLLEPRVAGQTPGFVAEIVARPRAEALVNGPGRAPFAAIASAATFAAWCASMLLASGIGRGAPSRGSRRVESAA